HALLGVVAGRELDFSREYLLLEALDAILHRRGIGAQHVQARTVGDDLDIHVLALATIMFDHIGGIVEHQVHHLRIVLVDLDRDAMGLAVGGKRGCSKRDRQCCGGCEATKHDGSPYGLTSVYPFSVSNSICPTPTCTGVAAGMISGRRPVSRSM